MEVLVTDFFLFDDQGCELVALRFDFSSQLFALSLELLDLVILFALKLLIADRQFGVLLLVLGVEVGDVELHHVRLGDDGSERALEFGGGRLEYVNYFLV